MKLIRSTAIISFFTMMSRILGLIRDQLTAYFLGAGPINDALITAMKLPNLFRRMFAEGAFNAAFIPLYVRHKQESGDGSAADFAGEAWASLFFIVALIVIGFQITMPWSLNMIGGGLEHAAQAGEQSVYDLAVLYARITMPYLLLMSLAALLSGMLNTENRFAIAAFVPVLYNLVAISILAAMWGRDVPVEKLALYLSIGMTVAGFLQLGLLFWAVRRAKIRLPFKRPRLTPRVKRLWLLGIPGMISAGITHINITVSNLLATFREGAASWLYYSDRLYQLPLGIIGIAMGVALLPALSNRLKSGDEKGAMSSMNRAIEIAALLTLPATFALAIMPEFLVSGLFELSGGRFKASDTVQTSVALRMFAFGLPAFVLLKVLTPAFFARENTKTPMIFAGVSAIINVILGASLFFTVGFFGLALATTIAGWTNVILLGRILLREKLLVFDKRLLDRLPRIAAASALMGLAIWPISQWGNDRLTGNLITDYFMLMIVCGTGLIIYVLASLIFKSFGANDLRYAFRRGSR
ncbi:MAG: murein biosynthesis integral membrane protein MurJ [Hellea sp.]|nr:murein biosynthesis integral membrane protein MurJ [Hellea sp.]